MALRDVRRGSECQSHVEALVATESHNGVAPSFGAVEHFAHKNLLEQVIVLNWEF